MAYTECPGKYGPPISNRARSAPARKRKAPFMVPTRTTTSPGRASICWVVGMDPSLSEGEAGLCGPAALVPEQPPLHLQPAAISAEGPIRGDHPVAGHHQGDRVPAVRRADGAGGGGLADETRQLSVGPSSPGRNGAQSCPDAL